MNRTLAVNSEALLRDILSRNPRVTLEDIRKAHPVFGAMSLDHLGLRVAQLIERSRASFPK